jgi:tRNA(Ile)-lysidine synthase
MGKRTFKTTGISIVAVSGGPDSVYLVYHCRSAGLPLLLAHFDHQARGKESEGDRKFVERLSRSLGLSLEVAPSPKMGVLPCRSSVDGKRPSPGFERKAREARYAFFREMQKKHGAIKILVGHTADDQVETVLMRVLEGAGITGLKGIPRETDNGIERPILDTWRDDILRYLKKQGISYRTDRSNQDTRFERNWIRHVLIPLLVKRYGKSLKKRIYTLGERFREIDVYVDYNAHMWLRKNRIRKPTKRLSRPVDNTFSLPREAYSGLPTLLRMKILQILCYECVQTAPGERLLASMDRTIVSGKSSARLSIGKGCTLRCRYGEAILSLPGRQDQTAKETGGVNREKLRTAEHIVRMKGPGMYLWGRTPREDPMFAPEYPGVFRWKEEEKTTAVRMRRISEDSLGAVFDRERLSFPLRIRALREGDRIRPFGYDAEKKVKKILIDRKVPRESRWGRPVVCDSMGEILWIPGILRSAHAPVTRQTRHTIVLQAETVKKARS